MLNSFAGTMLKDTIKRAYAKDAKLLFMSECKRELQFKSDLNNEHIAKA